MNMEEYMTIKKLHQAYDQESITPAGLIEEIIKKAEAYSDKNIWITGPDMSFIDKYLKKLGERDYEKKPLWGIPFAIKDNIDMEGLPTTAACPKYSYIATESATSVSRLIEAGAIPIGKSNLDQFATGLVGVRSPYGEVHNAIRDEMISGGSSSGSAVAVALNLAVFALGTDTAGSGRVPAALNHLIGYKPPRGSWPSKGVVPACASLDCVTVMAKAMEDIRLVDSIVKGYDPGDRWSREIIEKEAPRDMNFIIPRKDPVFYGPYAEDYHRAWDTTLGKIKAAGYSVKKEDCDFYQEAASLLYGGPCVAERWADLGEFITHNGDDIFPVTKEVLMTGFRSDYTAAFLYKVQHLLADYKRMAVNQLKDSLLIFPTCGGTYSREEVRNNPIETNSNMGRYTNHCNLLDLCAVDIPGINAKEDLPFGITLFAPFDEQRKLLKAAEEIISLQMS